MKDTALPSLDLATSSSLEVSFTSEELLTVIKTAKIGKAPGPDGFSRQSYKSFASDLFSIRLHSFNPISEFQPFPPETLKAYISVILKPGKEDETNPSSYRPISLLNQYITFYATLIANRLQPILPRIIHTHQTGFVRSRETRDNTSKILSLISLAQIQQIPTCLLSNDANKAFDRLN